MLRPLPRMCDPVRKNDAIFLYGATQPLPYVNVYCQDCIEVVHGPACKPELEIRVGQCRADSVEMQPRRGGGGVVVLAPGMAIIIVVGVRHKGTTIPAIFSAIHRPLISLLKESGPAGARIDEQGLSDLAISGRKICGSSLYLGTRPDFYYYQASLLVQPDLALLDRYLRHPQREPGYRAGRDHRAFCTSLAEQGWHSGTEEITALVKGELSSRIRGEDASAGTAERGNNP
jgi:lipoate-protein ligase A